MKPYMPLIGNRVYTDIGKTSGSDAAVAQYNRDLAQYEQTIALQKLAEPKCVSNKSTNYSIPSNYYRFNPLNPNHHTYIKMANKIDRFDNTYTPTLLLILITAIFTLFICLCINAQITQAVVSITIATTIILIYVRYTIKRLQNKLYNMVLKSKLPPKKEILTLQH